MKQKYRTLFISDVHMGTKISQNQRLLEFLKRIKVEKIYLVGDIIDVSCLRRKFYWNHNINAVIRRLFKLVKNGVQVIYIPGNHDSEIADFAGMDFSGISIKKDDVHISSDGKKYLIIHGDEFDGILREKMMFLYELGDRCYDFAIVISRVVRTFMKIFGIDWSLSYYLKTKVKNVVSFLNNFEKLMVHKAKMSKVDGIIAGHIHTPEYKIIDDIIYANCGCWTETCSAVVEHYDGSLEVLDLEASHEAKKELAA
jgi:UDP-2,3-diacylglucosamine pyrophosphatase LpxH